MRTLRNVVLLMLLLTTGLDSLLGQIRNQLPPNRQRNPRIPTSDSKAQQSPRMACDLITKSELESVLGLRVSAPETGSVWRVWKEDDVFFAGETSSSACTFKIARPEAEGTAEKSPSVSLGVRYLSSTDAQGLMERIRKYTSGNGPSRGEGGTGELGYLYNGRPFTYPALWVNTEDTAVIFKETPNGMTVLQLRMRAIPPPPQQSDLVNANFARYVNLAMKVLGEVKPSGIANVQIVSPQDSLRGQTSMAVEVSLNGELLSLVAQPQADMEQMLRENGVKIIRKSDTTTVPTLSLQINTLFAAQFRGPGITVYSMRLEYRQVVPLQSQNHQTRYIEVSTWSTGIFGVNSTSDRYRTEASGLMADFSRDYQRANGRGNGRP